MPSVDRLERDGVQTRARIVVTRLDSSATPSARGLAAFLPLAPTGRSLIPRATTRQVARGTRPATEHALVALRVNKPAQRYATGEQQGSTVRRGPLLEQHPTQVQLLTRLRPATARHVTQALGGLSFSPSVDLGLDSAGLVPV